jgi:TcpE family
MQIRTFTSFWQLDRKLYSIQDIQLPAPISLTQIGVALGFGVPWFIILNIVNLTWEPPWFLLWIAPPIIIAIYSTKPFPILGSRTLIQFLKSMLIFVLEDRKLKGLEPDLNKYNVVEEINSNVFTRKPRPIVFNNE